MPNNFRVSGNVYVSKAGNDANDGLTPDTPKLTVQAGLNLLAAGQTLVIGSGVYNEVIFKLLTTNYVVGDGKVVFEGNFTNSFSLGITQTSTNCYVYNIEVRNYYAAEVMGHYRQGSFLYFTNCTFKNCTKLLSSGGWNVQPYLNVYFNRCTIVNSIYTYGESTPGSTAVDYYQPTIFNKCILINFSFEKNVFLNANNQLLNSYLDANTVFKIPAGSTAANYNYNNIQGKMVVFSNGAVSGTGSNGVAQSFAQYRLDYPTFDVYSKSSDPKFNDAQALNFTLQQSSPNISASSDYISNIGGTEYAVYYSASSAAFTTNATSESLRLFGNMYYAISESATTGSITSGPMFLQWPRTKPLTSIQWVGSIDFNKTITSSLAGNNNVPAYTTYTSASGNVGANPDRLKIQMRFSTQQTQPATNAEWDNNGYWPAGTYQLFEIDSKPKVDYRGVGSGDPTYIDNSAIGDLVPSWIQTKIILRNDYNR